MWTMEINRQTTATKELIWKYWSYRKKMAIGVHKGLEDLIVNAERWMV